MNLAVLVVLIVLIFFFVESQNVWAAFLVALLIVVDVLAGVVSKMISALWALVLGLFGAGSAELTEMEKAKPKPPSGKKIIAKGLSDIGKSVGKGVKATKEGKKIKQPYNKYEFFSYTGKVADEIMKGIKGLFGK
ncbi:MAG: hypothetical protein COV47_04320 [Candidatus Diapherotrites archaeon CG11_big_fil_rev_8_21_14_0_20_37_9]|nr:MAG: hypothetical protein COV47_04320 [Candidatus Diapherotrites archaeon CG11_big_fil_rev_8_21_14_0_20_37_9]